jgi:hypothetical protein
MSENSLVADDAVELEDGVVLLGGEGPALDVRAQVVGPPQPAALATSVQSCPPLVASVQTAHSTRRAMGEEKLTGELGEQAPVARPIGVDEVDEQLVLLRRPRPLLHALAVAARRPPHRRRCAELERIDRSLSPFSDGVPATQNRYGSGVREASCK